MTESMTSGWSFFLAVMLSLYIYKGFYPAKKHQSPPCLTVDNGSVEIPGLFYLGNTISNDDGSSHWNIQSVNEDCVKSVIKKYTWFFLPLFYTEPNLRQPRIWTKVPVYISPVTEPITMYIRWWWWRRNATSGKRFIVVWNIGRSSRNYTWCPSASSCMSRSRTAARSRSARNELQWRCTCLYWYISTSYSSCTPDTYTSFKYVWTMSSNWSTVMPSSTSVWFR